MLRGLEDWGDWEQAQEGLRVCESWSSWHSKVHVICRCRGQHPNPGGTSYSDTTFRWQVCPETAFPVSRS